MHNAWIYVTNNNIHYTNIPHFIFTPRALRSEEKYMRSV